MKSTSLPTPGVECKPKRNRSHAGDDSARCRACREPTRGEQKTAENTGWKKREKVPLGAGTRNLERGTEIRAAYGCTWKFDSPERAGFSETFSESARGLLRSRFCGFWMVLGVLQRSASFLAEAVWQCGFSKTPPPYSNLWTTSGTEDLVGIGWSSFEENITE